MTVLKLEGEGDDWRLRLDGDWSLAAMAQIETQLHALPGATAQATQVILTFEFVTPR